MGQILSHRVVVMGREFSVKSTASPAKVAEIEQFLNSRLEIVSRSLPVGDATAALSLTLLDLAGEYLLLREELDRKEKENSERLTGLISKVDGRLF